MDPRTRKLYLHWLFLIVGTVSLITLALSVHTYFSYVQDGYGLRVEVESASLSSQNGNWLFLKLNVTNPGKLDILLEGGHLTLGSGEVYDLAGVNPFGIPLETYPLELPMRETSTMFFWFEISQDDFTMITSAGQMDISLNWDIGVPFRSASTILTFEDTVEVSV